MTASPANVAISDTGRSGLGNLPVFLLELLEATGLGLLVGGGALLLGRTTYEHIPEFVLGFAIVYLILLVISFVWQHSHCPSDAARG